MLHTKHQGSPRTEKTPALIWIQIFVPERIFEKVFFFKSQQGSKKHANFPSIKEFKVNILGLMFSRTNQSCLLIVSLL